MNEENISKLEEILNNFLDDTSSTHGLKRSIRSLKKEIVGFRNHTSNKQNIIENPEEDKLQIGGGKHTLEGYLNIDLFPPADVICDIREGIPFSDKQFSQIFTEHFFEHIDYPKSAKFVANEMFRVLKEGGELILGVPDTGKVLEAYVERDEELFKAYLEKWYSKRDCLEHFNTYIDLVNYHMRDQDDDPKYNPHFWGYDYEKLQNLLKSVGFINVEKWQFDSTIANPKREFGSIYVKAKK